MINLKKICKIMGLVSLNEQVYQLIHTDNSELKNLSHNEHKIEDITSCESATSPKSKVLH